MAATQGGPHRERPGESRADLSCGTRGNVIRFLPALTIPFELIDEGFDILEACLEEQLA